MPDGGLAVGVSRAYREARAIVNAICLLRDLGEPASFRVGIPPNMILWESIVPINGAADLLFDVIDGHISKNDPSLQFIEFRGILLSVCMVSICGGICCRWNLHEDKAQSKPKWIAR